MTFRRFTRWLQASRWRLNTFESDLQIWIALCLNSLTALLEAMARTVWGKLKILPISTFFLLWSFFLLSEKWKLTRQFEFIVCRQICRSSLCVSFVLFFRFQLPSLSALCSIKNNKVWWSVITLLTTFQEQQRERTQHTESTNDPATSWISSVVEWHSQNGEKVSNTGLKADTSVPFCVNK